MQETPVPRRYVRKLLQVASAQGLAPQAILSSSGIPSPDSEITAASYSRLYRQVCRQLADECFGFYPGHPLPCGSVELLCRTLLSARDLQEAAELTLAFFSLRDRLQGQAPILQKALVKAQDLCGLQHPPVNPTEVSQVFALQNGIAGALSSWHRLLGWLIGMDIPLRRVTLRGRPAINLDKFERIFRCPILFEAQTDAIWFHPDWCQRPVVQTPDSLRHFLRLAPYHLIARREADAERPLTLREQVAALLAPNPGRAAPDLAGAARLLGLSARTLRRRLAEENESFQRIKDDCRRQLAERLLLRPELTIQQVAEQLGFEETSAFHRAFRKWTGTTPGHFRNTSAASP